MPVVPRSGSSRLPVAIASGFLVVMTAAAAVAPEPIVGPPIAIGETGVAVADPLVPVPPTTPCVVHLYTADSPTGTFDDYKDHPFDYVPPKGCAGPWTKVVFKADFHVTPGIQYDRTASVWIGGTNVYFGTTQEPSPSVSPSWHVERDVTDLSSLLKQARPGNVAVYNIYNDTYNGLITGSATLEFYPATPEYPAPRVPDTVLSLSSDPAGTYANIDTDGDPLSRTFTLPTNIERAYVDVIAQPQSGDEFWYFCAPDEYAAAAGTCGGTAFREAEVSIDGKPAGIVPIAGWIYTGGLDPSLWMPIPGVQTLNFEPYRVDITPFAALLDDGQPHTVAVAVTTGDSTFVNQGQYFATAATLLLYQDPDATQLTGKLTQVADSGVKPVQTNSVSADGTTYDFKITSHHSLVTRGYLDTPQGRAQSNVVQDLHFSNEQAIVSTSTQYSQAVDQSSTATQRSFGSPADGPRNVTTNWSFPLAVDYDLKVVDNGFAQSSSATQDYSLRHTEAGGGHGAFRSERNQGGTSATTANYDADGNYTGNTGTASKQDYTYTDSAGSCYSRTVKSAAGTVTSVTDGAACK